MTRFANCLASTLVASAVCATLVAAQGPPPPTSPPLPGPPLRRIESAQALSVEPLGGITNVRQLSGGRVLLNDGSRRRLLMMDSTLKNVTVVLDSLTEVENAYGTRAGTLLPYVGDSTLFIDPATFAMLILDGEGKIRRVRSVPRAQDVSYLTNAAQYGYPGVDKLGRLVHRINAVAAPPTVAPPPGVPWFPTPPDSAFIVGVHLTSRKIDTLGVIRIPKVVYSMRMEPEGYYSLNMVSNPLPLVDDWGLLPDGTIAFVRGIDYRVEFRSPSGAMTSSEKQPFPWVRMADDDKGRFADSAKAVQIKSAQVSFATQMIAWSNLLNKPYPASFTAPDGYVLPSGLPKDWLLPNGVKFPDKYVPACGPNEPIPPLGTPDAKCTQTYFSEMYGSGYTPPAPTYRAPTLVRSSDLPDYKPPLANGSVRTDADGNVWVRAVPMGVTPGGPIYDIIDGKGVMVDRIQLPTGYSLVGFGEGRVVYLSSRDATGLHLARVRLK